MADLDPKLSGAGQTPDPAQDVDRADNFHQQLRAATEECHQEVDDLFGGFDLADPTSYAGFLTAHAKALLPVEDWLDPATLFPGLTRRGEALRSDLAALQQPVPPVEPIDWERDEASLWGTAYVVEGSRLGGLMLSRRVPDGLPHAYLSAAHPSGGWRAFLAALNEKAALGGAIWQEAATRSAVRAFAHYGRVVG
jgi:heme oxygenase